MACAVPGVEIADDRDAFGVRRPDCKPDASGVIDLHDLRAERVSELEVPSFVEQMQVDIAEQQPERIGVLHLLNRLRPDNPQQIRDALGHDIFEKAGLVSLFERSERCAVGSSHNLYFFCSRQKSANDSSTRDIVRSEHRERIAVRAFSQSACGLSI
jgi:hypothetical protein